MNMTKTREEWLAAAAQDLAPLLTLAGAPSDGPPVQISAGLPSVRALSRTKRSLGEYWAASDQIEVAQIFISPTLQESVAVLSTLLHELIHHAVPRAGHGPAFRAIAVAVGLEGKMSATKVGASLAPTLAAIAAALGPYPQESFDPSQRPKQSTRMCKVVCPLCGYTCRTTRKWLQRGTPTCPCGTRMEAAQ